MTRFHFVFCWVVMRPLLTTAFKLRSSFYLFLNSPTKTLSCESYPIMNTWSITNDMRCHLLHRPLLSGVQKSRWRSDLELYIGGEPEWCASLSTFPTQSKVIRKRNKSIIILISDYTFISMFVLCTCDSVVPCVLVWTDWLRTELTEIDWIDRCTTWAHYIELTVT